jgi:hypothetical protein
MEQLVDVGVSFSMRLAAAVGDLDCVEPVYMSNSEVPLERLGPETRTLPVV